ncbi:MAG: hypothetical protein GVY04_23725 [Cyanobacteria bacterium]|nr:hypothetical protein [Cyanobacteria bacterium GSL.Bin1]
MLVWLSGKVGYSPDSFAGAGGASRRENKKCSAIAKIFKKYEGQRLRLPFRKA